MYSTTLDVSFIMSDCVLCARYNLRKDKRSSGSSKLSTIFK